MNHEQPPLNPQEDDTPPSLNSPLPAPTAQSPVSPRVGGKARGATFSALPSDDKSTAAAADGGDDSSDDTLHAAKTRVVRHTQWRRGAPPAPGRVVPGPEDWLNDDDEEEEEDDDDFELKQDEEEDEVSSSAVPGSASWVRERLHGHGGRDGLALSHARDRVDDDKEVDDDDEGAAPVVRTLRIGFKPCYIRRLLAEDHLLYICTYLGGYSTVSLGLACKEWLEMINDEAVWREICLQLWPLSRIERKLPACGNSWKRAFREVPHVRFDGLYILDTTYFQKAAFGQHSGYEMVHYYRAVRFFPNGEVHYCLNNEKGPLLRYFKERNPRFIKTGAYHATSTTVKIVVDVGHLLCQLKLHLDKHTEGRHDLMHWVEFLAKSPEDVAAGRHMTFQRPATRFEFHRVRAF